MGTLREDTSIAIIGLAGRFPKAPDPRAFWRLLRDGGDGITRFSPEELLAAGVPPATIRDPAYVRARGILSEDDGFDAALFGMGAHEAERTDPQQRVWLECALAALEDAGCNPRTYPGLIGVFAGVGSPDYLLRWPSASADPLEAFQLLIGNDKDFVATRTSYKLGLRGPSLAVQTACSTSLVAVVLACQQLLSCQCDVAIAGGASLSIPAHAGYWFREGMILSPDGCCRAFDARAQGTVPGDGVGAVVLKRLSEARADGDDIYAVLRGAAMNNDGDAKLGYAAPCASGQVEVITQALAFAGISAAEVSFVETHGTGTPLGDPIEFAALRQVFVEAGAARGSCALGAVKTNIGHLNAAAGVAGLIKAVLALRHRALPPNLHFERPHPGLDLDASPFYVSRALRPWSARGPLIAGVSAFGIGGTNAHVLVSEAPARARHAPRQRLELVPLSAATPHAVERLAAELAVHLEADQPPLASVAHTLQTGRMPRRCRRALLAGDAGQAIRKLQQSAGCVQTPDAPAQIGFLFPGQGSQWPGMAAVLAREEPHVQEELVRADGALRAELGLSLIDILDARRPIEQTQHAQPVLFAVEYALARVLARWGLSPAAMLGHSLGEYVAACLAGVFPLEAALSLVAERGRLMQDTAPGAMLSVPLAEAEVLPLLESALDLAAVNGPHCVISGEAGAIDALAQVLAARGLEGRRLRTHHAFHSRLMEPILERFTRWLARIPLRAPKLPFLSCLTGDWIDASAATAPEYWARQLRGTVRFDAALGRLFARASLCLEVGPGDTLSALARRHPARPERFTVLTTLGRQGEGGSETERWLGAVAAAWCAGASVDWAARRDAEPVEKVHLPTYPFDRQRYWGLRGGRPGTRGAASRAGRPLPVRDTLGGTLTGRRESLPLHGQAVLDPRNALTAPSQETAPLRPQGPPGWLYAPVWRPAPPLAAGRPARRWLVFAERHGLGEALARRLGEDTVLVSAGARFEAHGSQRFTVAPEDRAAMAALLAALEPRPVDGIVHAFALDAPQGLAGLDEALARGYLSVVALVQALGAAARPDVQLTVLTAGAQAARGAPTDPVAAMLCGLGRVLPAEYPGLAFRHIDLAGGAVCDAELVALLAAELAGSFAVPVVALRAGERLACTYEPMGEPRVPPAPMLHEGGIYLVTGGLGGVGLALAEHLAATYGARLILASRSGLWPESQWPALRARPKHDEERLRLETYLRVQAAAGGVIVQTADVADPSQARALVELAYSRFGALDGVIHAAGVTGGRALQRRVPTDADPLLRAKVHGTLALEAALAGVPIDFFLLCSSLTALTGGFGQADYAAANAFLDAYAESRNRPGERLVLSVNWDGWREVGAAARAAARRPAAPPAHPLLDGWEATVRGGAHRTDLSGDRWIVAEHRVGGCQMVPGAAYAELVCAAARARGMALPLHIRELLLLRPLTVQPGERAALYTSARETAAGLEIRIESQDRVGPWRLHASAQVAAAIPAAPAALDPARLLPPEGDGSAAGRGRAGHIDVGPRWQCLDWTSRRGGESVGHLRLPAAYASEAAAFTLHPALFDAMTSVIGVGDDRLYLPFSYSGMTVYEPLGAEVYCVASARESAGVVQASLRVAGLQGRLLVEIEAYTLRPAAPKEET